MAAETVTKTEKRQVGGKLAAAVICANLLNFAGLYYLFTPQLRGLNNSARIPFEEPGVDVIKSDRYVSIYPTLGDSTPFDHNASMAYNLATVFGLNCYLGYDSIIPDSLFKQNPTLSFTYAGVVTKLEETTVDAFRRCGVRWYVVFDGDYRYLSESEAKRIPVAKEILEKTGCELLYREGDRLFYYDKEASPVVSCNGREIKYDIHGNYIDFWTDSQSEGGVVKIHFNYDENFTAYVDDTVAELGILADGEGMYINVPGGAHEVRISYSDHFERNLATVLGTFAIMFAVFCLFKRLKKKQTE